MRRLLMVAFTVVGSGCAHDTFKYAAESPMHLGQADETKAEVGRVVQGEASGFVWASCDDVNRNAIKDLMSKCKKEEQITELEWLDHRTGEFSSTPICLTEKGWAWTVYAFWWPSATKVAVRGKITVPKVAGGEVVSGDSPKVAGSDIDGCKVEKTGDKFDAAITYSSASCAEHALGASYAFLRAFVGKENGTTQYQIYAIVTASEWPRLYAAAFVKGGKAADIPVQEIDKNVKCTASAVCMHTIHATFDVTREDLERFVKQGQMEFKLKGQARSEVLTISRQHLDAFLRAVKSTSNVAH